MASAFSKTLLGRDRHLLEAFSCGSFVVRRAAVTYDARLGSHSQLPDEGTREISMSGRNRAARAFVILGSVVLFASAALHFFGGYTQIFPLYATSNLSPRLKEAFQVVFLSLGWHWAVTAVVALLAGLTGTRLRKALVLICGLAVLIEAGVGAGMMGFFIGNELTGAAALLLVCGGMLFDQLEART
jgi:hypothetical protein